MLVVVVDEGVTAVIGHFWNEIQACHEQGKYDTERPLLPPQEVFIPEDEFC